MSMKNKKPIAELRRDLAIVLKKFNLSAKWFDSLPGGSYEQVIALHSLEELERLYWLLLTPGRTLMSKHKDCPRWPAGNVRAGDLPTYNLVSEIAKRLRSAQYLEEHSITVDNRPPIRPVRFDSGRHPSK